MSAERFELTIAPTARRQLTDKLPDAVAFAAYKFIVGPLLDDPHRVGKRLRPPLDDRYCARRGTYRVIYRIDAERHRVTVVGVVHRADAYRPQQRTRLGSGIYSTPRSVGLRNEPAQVRPEDESSAHDAMKERYAKPREILFCRRRCGSRHATRSPYRCWAASPVLELISDLVRAGDQLLKIGASSSPQELVSCRHVMSNSHGAVPVDHS